MTTTLEEGTLTAGPDDPLANTDPAAATAMSLARIESELQRQGDAAKKTYTAFAFFAFMAVVIALASLIAVSFKLGTKDIRVTTTAPRRPRRPPRPPSPRPLRYPARSPCRSRSSRCCPRPRRPPPGKVTFNVRNSGNVTHEFVVLKTDKPAGSLLKGSRADETGNVGETGDLAAGASKSITLKLAARPLCADLQPSRSLHSRSAHRLHGEVAAVASAPASVRRGSRPPAASHDPTRISTRPTNVLIVKLSLRNTTP